MLTLLSVCLCSVRLPGRLLRGCVLTQGDASPRVGALARSVLQPMVALLGGDGGGGMCGGSAAGIATSRTRTVAGWEGVVVQKDLETP